MKIRVVIGILLLINLGCIEKEKKETDENATVEANVQTYNEPFRPQYHFSPEQGWMNDPNGLVYHNGDYHLFYQYYPHATVWGPMHWGHAVSKDLVTWEHKPIALFPDEKGYIFSGSAVVDTHNTSGFSTTGEPPLVAIFTYFSLPKEKSGSIETQSQGIAYSLDNGVTWEKYGGNPVLPNPGIKDYRDPKVFWHEPTKKWIMLLVAGDYVKLYSSKNLKKWNFLSDFGKELGSKGGVWECPDLFPLTTTSGETKWVMVVSIGNGAPNGGSGTQYFVGDFNGTQFTTNQKEYKWLDWGTDNYAGITYNNTPNNERIFIGWMSNWQYALKTPTTPWRSAMTLPRELILEKVNNTFCC